MIISNRAVTSNQTLIESKRSFLVILATVVFVSWLNPFTLIDTFVTIGSITALFHGYEKIIFISACVFTSWVWFILLVTLGYRVGSLKVLEKISGRYVGILLWLLSIVLIYKLVTI